MTTRQPLLFALLLLAPIFLARCGSDSESGGTSGAGGDAGAAGSASGGTGGTGGVATCALCQPQQYFCTRSDGSESFNLGIAQRTPTACVAKDLTAGWGVDLKCDPPQACSLAGCFTIQTSTNDAGASTIEWPSGQAKISCYVSKP